MKLIITRGLPASGKTKAAREWVNDEETTHARVNRDSLRQMLHNGVYKGRDTERQVTAVRDAAIVALLDLGINVVNDDTNLPQPVARDLARLGRQHGAEIEVWDLTDVPLEQCLLNDARDETYHGYRPAVGADVIQGMYDRFLAGATYPLPLPVDAGTEDGDDGYRYKPEPTGTPAVMVDLDGTLAHMDGRSPFEWHRVGEDRPDIAVRELVQALALTRPVIVMSGRDETCRTETATWLHKHRIPYDELFMRPAGDQRKDSIVKLELFREHVADRYAIQFVLDDRDQVVEMWRRIGLPCFQVAPGAF